MIHYPLYLVPFDFSEISNNALKLSLELAHVNNGSVFLMNVVKVKPDRSKAQMQLKKVIDDLSPADQKLITKRVLIGNIYEEIGKASEILRPSLVVMGTHGASGIQKIFGSHVEKIISNSATPLLITRGDKHMDKVKTIVMPFSFQKESIQITSFAANMAKKFGACIHLVGNHDNNELHEDGIATNQLVVERFMNENNIDFKMVDLPQEKDFYSELLDYAGSVHAEVIAATYSNGTKLVTNPHMQRIIENIYRIPVLTVNAEELV
ncbi:MAG: universal stress protein [Crocinitomicaceae bacterium]|nr:universal stress protein [Crocinitomicaceae bacterium]